MCVNKQVKIHKPKFFYIKLMPLMYVLQVGCLLVFIDKNCLLLFCTCLHYKPLWQNVFLHDNLIKSKWMQEPYLQKWSNWRYCVGLNRDMIAMSISSTLQMWSLYLDCTPDVRLWLPVHTVYKVNCIQQGHINLIKYNVIMFMMLKKVSISNKLFLCMDKINTETFFQNTIFFFFFKETKSCRSGTT